MSSYVITGASRGMGWEFMRQLSRDPSNTVIGIVRDKLPTAKRVADELEGRSNITIIEADITKYEDIKRAATQAAIVTGGRLDYLFANAGQSMFWDAFEPIGILAEQPEEFENVFSLMMNTNVLANIHLYTLFMPQILKGGAKTVVNLTSAMGDVEFTKDQDLTLGSLYATSKAAMNMVTTKFAAQYKKDNVLFLGICPGVVNTGQFDNVTPAQMAKFKPMLDTWQQYAPDFKGPVGPESAVGDVLSVVQKCSVENGDSGAILSHLGTKQWL
ncbi:hypothetical protein ONZ43_g6233 [Nemania bipapillata]|uniref:Uncharacterized protein n=1 Tax=Nemania bipapillata TaxID=110536 RepID=A0ACC2I170_9PEZI|nr:hypothetical protein ONZ43_g6233 [Nemania bipapillata]